MNNRIWLWGLMAVLVLPGMASAALFQIDHFGDCYGQESFTSSGPISPTTSSDVCTVEYGYGTSVTSVITQTSRADFLGLGAKADLALSIVAPIGISTFNAHIVNEIGSVNH